MTRLIRMLALLCAAMALIAFPAFGQDVAKKKSWTGKLGNGKIITVEDMQRILDDHKKWLVLNGKEGKKANLWKADLTNANLRKADLSRADLRRAKLNKAKLSRADLSGADLENANLSNADLRRAKLKHTYLVKADLSDADLEDAKLNNVSLNRADLSNANLKRAILANASLLEADLTLADFWGANLNNADLRRAKLNNTNFEYADMNMAVYEPKIGTMPQILSMVHARNLENLSYSTYTHGLIRLRKEFRQKGFREQERKITYALKHSSNQHMLNSFWGRIWGNAQLILFEWTSDWGMSPGRPLIILISLLAILAFPYMFALIGLSNKHGIWRDWLRNGSKTMDGSEASEQLKCSSALQIWGYGLYFSLLSAVHIGWRDLNVGNWITRMQPREYTLRATGWVRTVSGIQSLISVYLLALAILTYFGRPFDQF